MSGTYNKEQLLNKGKVRRIVIEFEDYGTELVVLDDVDAQTFLDDWLQSLPEGERLKLLDS